MPSAPLRTVLLALNAVGYRSLALGYLRAFAQADDRLAGRVGFETLDLDVSLDPWWVAWRVLALEPDVVGMSVFCWNARSVYEIARIVRAARPQTLIVLGGPEVGPIARDVLETRPAVDAVVRGEGEVTFSALLDAVSGESPLECVEGVTVRLADGNIIEAPDRALVADLDGLPSPYLTGVLRPTDGGCYLETYRGCPHGCAYCFEGKGYGRIRSFSRERVEAEVALVAATPGVRSFSFIDPVFNLTADRLEWLAGVMEPHARAGLRLHTVEVDIERIDEAAAAQLVRAGVASVETGPQTVTPPALETCHRTFDAERFASGVTALRRAGIVVECDFIVGLPGDDVYGFVAGLRYALGLDPGRLQTSTLHVLPGTELWRRAGELGLRYDAEPPHELIATPSASYLDLRRAEVFGVAVQAEYRSRM